MAERATKRARLEEDDTLEPELDANMAEVERDEFSDLSEGGSESEGESLDSEGVEIFDANEAAQQPKAKKPRKRALSPSAFGASLNSLLAAPEPSAKAIAHLNKSSRADAQLKEAKLEKKALTYLQNTKHERQERGHVKDVIGGWGPRPAVPFSQWNNVQGDHEWTVAGAEGEKVLRKLAQRGVVKLFNAIRAAQSTNDEAGESDLKKEITQQPQRKAIEGPMPPVEASVAGIEKHRPNILGSKGKEQALANLSKASFLEILKNPGQSTA